MVTAPVQPPPLPRPALDSHTHLDMIDFREGPGGRLPGRSRVAEVVAAARSAGIARIVTVGTDLETSRWSARCADEHDGVYAAVAIHPNETQAVSAEIGAGAPAPDSPAAAEVLAGIEALARSPRVVAVGETGLDYYRRHAEPDVQRWWFREHIAIAKRTGRALMIHDREAHADVLRILAAEGPPDRVVFHCFSGDVTMVKQCAEAGYVMSFAGNVTFAKAQPLRDAAAAAPPELILAETDAPYLTPVPNRGRPNEPALTADTLRCLAEVQGMDLAALCDAVTATAARTFGPW
ncbi:MAG TPA: TatD family hydrolase [Streptosporangiaceae bacterium]|nr:TatD family hydrolase [Streptosporangiaceae bacterium]